MLGQVVRFATFKDACQGCGETVSGLKRVCPHCGRAYPTARRAFYWAYVVLVILAIPSTLLFVLWYYLGVRI